MEGGGRKPNLATEADAPMVEVPVIECATPAASSSATEPMRDDSAAHAEPADNNTERTGQPSKGHSSVCQSLDDNAATSAEPTDKAASCPAPELPVSSVPVAAENASSGGSLDTSMTPAAEADDSGAGMSTRDLPDEILDHLLTFVLPYEDMQNCKLVSRRWYNAVKRQWPLRYELNVGLAKQYYTGNYNNNVMLVMIL